ncbi:MAG: ABC transporter substrate-binding protein [Candidatus Margulisiibacteriota bacterium]
MNNQIQIIKLFGHWLLRFGICLVVIPKSLKKLLFNSGTVVIGISWLLVICPIIFAQPKYPQRIISGMPSITEMLFALGLEDRIVGVTANCNYPPEALKKEKIGGFFLNLEKIVSLKPDLVVMLEDTQKQDIKRLKDYGLPVYTINPHTVVEVMDSLVKLGEVTGKRKEAKILIKQMKNRIASVQPKGTSSLERPRVLVIVGYRPLIVAGAGTFIDDIIKYAGGENIAQDAKASYPQYSFERLIKEDPEYMIIPEGVVEKEEIARDSRWQSLQAVRGNKILFINADILSRPGPRLVEAIEKIADFIH